MPTSILKKHPALILLLSAIIISLSFLTIKNKLLKSLDIKISRELGQEISPGFYDYGDYTLQVNNLIQTGIFKKNDEILNRYPPVFPLILFSYYSIASYLGIDNRITIQFFTVLFNFLSAFILMKIFLFFNKNRILALLTGLIFLVHPYTLQSLTKVMSVSPFMTFFFISIFILFKTIKENTRNNYFLLIFTGLVLGISILTRPIAVFVPFIFVFIYLIFLYRKIKYKSLINSSLILVGTLMIVLPWQLYNRANDQKILVAANDVKSIIHGVTFNNSPLKEKIDLDHDVNKLAIRLSESHIHSRSEFFNLLKEEFKNNPKPVIELFLIKAARSWYGTFSQNHKK